MKYRMFCLPVDSVERVIGIDLFAELPDSIEKAIECRFDRAFWNK